MHRVHPWIRPWYSSIFSISVPEICPDRIFNGWHLVREAL